MTKKAEVQSQKRAEKAAKEAAAREADLRSYSHILKVGPTVLEVWRNKLCTVVPDLIGPRSIIVVVKHKVHYTPAYPPEAYVCQWWALSAVQEENMVSSKDVGQKYSSFAAYEEDFM